MTQFFFLAALLLVAAYLLFVPALRGTIRPAASQRDKLHLLMYKQRRQELEQELAQGNIEQTAYDRLCQELDLQLLGETAPQAGPLRRSSPGRWPVLAALLALPFLAYGLYGHLGRPDLLDAATATATAPAPEAQAMEESRREAENPRLLENIQLLARRLEKAPDDLQGWVLLGRSYQATKQPAKAQTAYEKALALAPDNLDIKILYAQALAEGQNNRLQGRPAQIVAEVLKADPAFPNGLWLAGLAAAEQGDAKAALSYWEKLKAQFPADSEEAKRISGYMAMLGGQPGGEAAAPKPKLRIKVKVALAPSLVGKAQPNDTVFVFAKAASGPPMPLAIVRKQVKDLPLEVTLDDSMAMAPGMNLSAFPKIVLGARVSKSGQAMPASGDLQGFSEPTAPTADKSYGVLIDQAVP